MSETESIDQLLDLYDRRRHDFRIFMEGVVAYIGEHPDLNSADCNVIHSYKSRMKDRDHLRDKITRKNRNGRKITLNTLFKEVTDLAGVRILHLYKSDFCHIDGVIRRKISDGDWYLAERAKAYTWDPENVDFFNRFDLDVSEKSTSYTSVHYLVRPREDSPICCEVQVRTLFEEIWGEVDHQINYPVPTTNTACREQIKVLSKIVGAGSRLLDSLQVVRNDR